MGSAQNGGANKSVRFRSESMRRALTNTFIQGSHTDTLNKLQTAAFQKMLYKREQLEEELRVLDGKMKDEMKGGNH